MVPSMELSLVELLLTPMQTLSYQGYQQVLSSLMDRPVSSTWVLTRAILARATSPWRLGFIGTAAVRVSATSSENRTILQVETERDIGSEYSNLPAHWNFL